MGTVTIRNNKEMDLVNSYMSSLVHLTDRMKWGGAITLK